jgi:hypothetical protein
MPGRQKIDWDAMEPDWRAGLKTKKQLSEEYGVSRAAIDKHWSALGIDRDLSDRIRSAAKTKVTRSTVTSGVTPDTKVTEREVVEANADMLAAKHIEHRTDIPAKRELVGKLFAELEALTDGKDLMAQVQVALEQGDLDKLAEAAEKVASLPSRIKGVSDLVGAYKALIMLERQAFGLEDSRPADPIQELCSRIDGLTKGM